MHSAILLEGTIRVRKPVPWHSLQEIMHFDFGQEPAGVTDRMIVFERFVGENETSSGEALGVQVKCAVFLERVPPKRRTHLLLTCGSRPDYAIMRQTVGSYSVARRSWQPSHSTTMGEAPERQGQGTRVNTRAGLSLKATVVTVESGDTSKKTVDKRTLLPKWMRPPPPGLFSAGTAQSTTGTIPTLMEAHAQSGWLCELVVGSDDARVRKCDFVEPHEPVDTGATDHVCGPHDFTHAALKNGPRPAFKTATGELLKHCGTRTVDFRCQGEELRVGFTVVDVKRPILSVSRLMDRGIETFIQAGKQFLLRRFDGATVELTRRGGLFVLQCQAVVPMLLAPVDEEPAGEAPDRPTC